tara:strand:- start:16872 stop:18011 length:1140 start_codon:yes stop_codon:yes gene_type:complete
MKIENLNIEKIKPYEKNPRKNKKAIEKVAKSIDEYGFRQPIVVDEDMIILAGHTRLEAAKKLNLKEVPIHIADGLSEAQKKGFRIMDNRSAQEAEWDMDLLKLELTDLHDLSFDLSLTGLNNDELAGLLSLVNEGLTDEDAVPDLPEEPTTKLGDLWILGDHRLLCGDSTSIDAVDKLMDGNKPDMVFTDPPYNIDYQGVKDKREKIINDKMHENDFEDFLIQSLMGCEVMYVCCSWQYAHTFKKAMEKIARKPKAMIVWNKVNPAQHLDKYFKQHEIIFYYGDFGGQKTLRGDIWELKRQKNTYHPTTKPVELIDMAIIDQPEKNKIYDGFGGSGSTLISCEKNNRKCFMMELDPKYCDVIIQRWEEYTGKKAELLNG